MLRIGGSTHTSEEEEKRTAAAAEMMTRSVHPDEPEDVALRVELVDAHSAWGSACWPQYYCAMLSLSPEGCVQMSSPIVRVNNPYDFPVWRSGWKYILTRFPWGTRPCLRVEIIRLLTLEDMQTTSSSSSSSACRVVIGRAEVPLPKRLRQRKAGKFDLVRLEGRNCVFSGAVRLLIELLPLPTYYHPPSTLPLLF